MSLHEKLAYILKNTREMEGSVQSGIMMKIDDYFDEILMVIGVYKQFSEFDETKATNITWEILDRLYRNEK